MNLIRREQIFNKGFVQLYNINYVYNDIQILKQDIGFIASSCTGQSTKIIDLEKLITRLFSQASLATPARPFQFIPYVQDLSYLKSSQFVDSFNNFLKFGKIIVIKQKPFLLTNLRNILKFEKIKSLEQFCDKKHKSIAQTKEILNEYKFLLYRIKIPMFVRDQLRTHTQISQLNVSNRLRSEQPQYYLPNDYFEKYKQKFCLGVINDKEKYTKTFFEQNATTNAVNVFKQLGYPKQIYSRFPTQMKYGVCWMAGWQDDNNGFKNLFLQRNVFPQVWTTWAQYQTVEYCRLMHKMSI